MDLVDSFALGGKPAHIVGDQRIVDKLRNSVVSATETHRPILVARHYPHLSADPFWQSFDAVEPAVELFRYVGLPSSRDSAAATSPAASSKITTGVHGSRVTP